MHGQVETRIQLAVIGNHDILVSSAILLVIQRFYGDAAVLGLGRAVDGDNAVRYLQADIILRQDRVFCRHLANLDAAVIQIHGHAAASRGDGGIHRGIAILGGNLDIAASGQLAFAALLAYNYTAVFCFHGHALIYSDCLINVNTALPDGLRMIVAARSDLVRHMDVAVLHDHGGVVGGLHLAVLVNDNVLSGVARCIGFVPGQ